MPRKRKGANWSHQKVKSRAVQERQLQERQLQEARDKRNQQRQLQRREARRFVVMVNRDGQRIRNVLTLEERVAVIEQYRAMPMYTKLAQKFNCGWEQIKRIVENRKPILELYKATRGSNKTHNSNAEELRRRQLQFLNDCLYEFIQRTQYYQHTDINEDLIRTKALVFRDLIGIDNFMPNKSWLNHFKAAHNITLSNRQIVLTRRPPASMDLRDIMCYCSNKSIVNEEVDDTKPPEQQQQQHQQLYLVKKGNSIFSTKTKAAASIANQETIELIEQQRMYKIRLLEKVVYEYIQRLQSPHSKEKEPIDLDELLTIAINLRDILKIKTFFPDKNWFNRFIKDYKFTISEIVLVTTTTKTATHRRDPLSLDLHDIISYCVRQEGNLNNITLLPKELQNNTNNDDHDDDDDEDVNDDCVEIETPTELIEIKDEADDNDNNNADVYSGICLEIESTVCGENNNELCLKVRNYSDALRVLKPLEEFALTEENERAIKLLTELDQIFLNSLSSSSPSTTAN